MTIVKEVAPRKYQVRFLGHLIIYTGNMGHDDLKSEGSYFNTVFSLKGGNNREIKAVQHLSDLRADDPELREKIGGRLPLLFRHQRRDEPTRDPEDYAGRLRHVPPAFASDGCARRTGASGG